MVCFYLFLFILWTGVLVWECPLPGSFCHRGHGRVGGVERGLAYLASFCFCWCLNCAYSLLPLCGHVCWGDHFFFRNAASLRLLLLVPLTFRPLPGGQGCGLLSCNLSLTSWLFLLTFWGAYVCAPSSPLLPSSPFQFSSLSSPILHTCMSTWLAGGRWEQFWKTFSLC